MGRYFLRPHFARTQWIWFTFSVCAIFALGYSVAHYVDYAYPQNIDTTLRQDPGSYTYIDPLLVCGVNDNKNFAEYSSLKNSVSGIIADAKSSGKVSDVSVYFRDLNAGKWMGIRQDELYAPASLDKITLLIAYLKKADSDKRILTDSYVFTGTREAGTPDYPLMTIGKSYTVRELLTRLIVNSDNDAKDMLHDHIDQTVVDDVFTDLSLRAPALDDRGDSMSAKSYSLFFRTLYNATYLSRENSEFALELLSDVVFKDGLAAALPANVRVAHKFGYRVFDPPQDGVTAELHDCGIVYSNTDPYFICVMTKGSNYQDLASVIQDISKAIYTAEK